MSEQDFSALEALPRVTLAQLPTLIEPLPRLSAALAGPEIWVKRDDQTGLAFGGNKTRKLEYLMAQAIRQNADTVITAGSVQSNHARQTAAAAAKLGLGCHLVLRGSPDTNPALASGNLLLDALFGATLHFTTEQAPYIQTINEVRSSLEKTHTPYIVPYGGSDAFGIMGYVNAMQEYAAQATLHGPFDAITFATSSGGTQAGLLLGAHLAGLPTQTRILGISVDAPIASLRLRVEQLIHEGAALLDMELDTLRHPIAISEDYLGGGYAVVGDAEREAIKLMARHEGLLVDPVYTGRALAGLIDLIRRGELTHDQRILFWHTGGTSALFAFAETIAPAN